MDLIIDHHINNIINIKCHCDDDNYNCINLDKCKNRNIIIENCPLLSSKCHLVLKSNDNMMNPGDFKKLLEYIIKYNINNSNKDKENKIIFLFSYYYLLIKNIKLISSLYFFYEQFILFAFTSLKYNILINNKYLARFNNYFIKNFKEKINCDKLLNEWCDIFEEIIKQQN